MICGDCGHDENAHDSRTELCRQCKICKGFCEPGSTAIDEGSYECEAHFDADDASSGKKIMPGIHQFITPHPMTLSEFIGFVTGLIHKAYQGEPGGLVAHGCVEDEVHQVDPAVFDRIRKKKRKSGKVHDTLEDMMVDAFVRSPEEMYESTMVREWLLEKMRSEN